MAVGIGAIGTDCPWKMDNSTNCNSQLMASQSWGSEKRHQFGPEFVRDAKGTKRWERFMWV